MFSQQLVVFVLVALLPLVTMCSQLNVHNNCPYRISAVWTGGNGQAPRELCGLNPGQWCFMGMGGSGNLKNGYGGRTLAEFSFAAAGKDWYDLSVIVSYDVPMQIHPHNCGDCGDNCPTVTCGGPRCPDAYLFPTDDTKTHCSAANGQFDVHFCP